MLLELHKQFIREKRYVGNASPHTITFYQDAFRVFSLGFPEPVTEPFQLSLPILKAAVANLRESGKSAACVDARIRGVNPFLTWLFENRHTAQHLKIPRLKLEKKVMRPFTDAHLKAIIGYKPQTFYEQRFYALICFLLRA